MMSSQAPKCCAPVILVLPVASPANSNARWANDFDTGGVKVPEIGRRGENPRGKDGSSNEFLGPGERPISEESKVWRMDPL